MAWAVKKVSVLLSYDFELYVGNNRQLPEPPLLAFGNIRFDGPDRVEVDDIPLPYLSVVGKKTWLYRIHLEGQIEQDEHRQIDGWLRAIITVSKGVLIDLQTEEYETPRKSGTINPAIKEAPQMATMRFYFEDGEAFYKHGFEAMLSKIKAIIPSALPKRYGRYEPLQGKVEQGQYTALVSEFHADPNLFLKASTPFSYIYMSIPCKKTFERYHSQHFIRRHFLLGNVEFELRAKIFESPADLAALLELFKALCVEFNVVYAEILRTVEPSDSWFWHGLPDRKSAHSICVGPRYQKVWSDAAAGGDIIGEQHRFFASDRLGSAPPRPPADLLAPDQNGKLNDSRPVYASVFPFDFVFDENKYIW